MQRTQSLIFGAAVVAAMFVGGVIGAAVLARSTNVSAAQNVATAASPTPGFKSNEVAAHETGESAAHETAENNGTFRPAGGAGFGPGGSNETSAHETGEPATREAAENAAKAPSTTNPPSTTTN